MTFDLSEGTEALAATREYLTFFIAGEEYAVSLEFVREVIPYDTVTRVPNTPEAVRGVTNLRGSVVPVIDLAIKFRLPEIAVTPRTCIVLVETILDDNPVLMGLMTEEVGQVLALGSGELLASPSFGAPIRTDFLVGMARVGKKFALVLDIQRVLSARELLSAEALEGLSEAPGAEPELAVATSDGADGNDDDGWQSSTDGAHADDTA